MSVCAHAPAAAPATKRSPGVMDRGSCATTFFRRSFTVSFRAVSGAILMTFLVLLHIGAIAFYRIKRKKDLIRPMLIGDVSSPTPQLASRDDAGSRALAAVILLGSAGAVAALLKQVA